MALRNIHFSGAVLLHGPKKSGTSLLHNLLDGGSELLMLPGELKIKHLYNHPPDTFELAHSYLRTARLDFKDLIKTENQNGHKRYSANPEYYIDGLSKEQSDEVFDSEKYVHLLQEMTTLGLNGVPALVEYDAKAFAASLRDNHRQYSQWAGKEVPGNTTDIINRFRLYFPNSKIVLLARDPKFIVRSRVLERRRSGRDMGFRKTWQYCVFAQETIDYIFHQGMDRDIVVIYEKLTQDIETEMRRLARLIEIPFEPILCQPTALGLPVVVRTSSQKTTKVFQQVPDWKKDLKPAQIAAIKWFHRLAPHLMPSRKYVPYDRLLVHYENSKIQMRD